MNDITKDVKYAIDLFPWLKHEDIDEGEVWIGSPEMIIKEIIIVDKSNE